VYSVVLVGKTTEYTENTEQGGIRRSRFSNELDSRMQAMKALSRTLFAAYLLILLWLVLFKFSYDPIGVIRDFQTRASI
jgi:hypothetical protein